MLLGEVDSILIMSHVPTVQACANKVMHVSRDSNGFSVLL
jgi:DNA repair ATPase RecN